MTREELISFNKANRIDGYPGTMQKIQKVFDPLPLESATDYHSYWLEVYNAKDDKRQYAYKYMKRSISLMEKYINLRKQGEDESYTLLTSKLESLLATFKETYLKSIRKYASRQYAQAMECRLWNSLDWLATGYNIYTKYRAGYKPCVLVPYHAANGKEIWVGVWKNRGRQIEELTDIKEGENYTYYTGQLGNTNICISPSELHQARTSDKEKLEVPAHPTTSRLKDLYNSIKVFAGFEEDSETKWCNKAQEEAEAKFREDVKVLADKIRMKSIQEDKLSLKFAGNDPKHIEIEITDGTTTLYARSIFAAEYSLFVSPHFRFIVTEK